MRGFFLVAMVLGAASGVQAADMPDFLRGSLPGGPAPTVNWAGFYIGGQGSYGSPPLNVTPSLNSDLLANNVVAKPVQVSLQWHLLGQARTVAAGYGGFVGLQRPMGRCRRRRRSELSAQRLCGLISAIEASLVPSRRPSYRRSRIVQCVDDADHGLRIIAGSRPDSSRTASCPTSLSEWHWAGEHRPVEPACTIRCRLAIRRCPMGADAQHATNKTNLVTFHDRCHVLRQAASRRIRRHA